MSRDDRLPATTGRAIVVAAAVGTIALAVFEPTVVAGALLGIGFAATVELFDGSYWRVAVAAALLPPLSLAGVAVVGLSGTPVPALLVIVGALTAGTASGGVVGHPTPSVLLRTGAAALCGAVAAGGAALLAIGSGSAGGLRPLLASAMWIAGDGAIGLAVAIGAACVAVVGALFLVPPAAVTVPTGRSSYRTNRIAIATGIAVLTVLALVVLSALTVLSWYVPALESIVDSAVVRGPIAAVTIAAVAVAGFAAVVRGSWVQSEGRRNAVVAFVVGSILGVGLSFAGTVAAGVETSLAVLGFGATAVVLGGVWLGAWLYEGRLLADDTMVPHPVTALAAVLGVGAVVVGTSADVATLDLETVRAGTATLVATAAALFAYDVGRYGRTLTREVGLEADRRAQLVRLGWSGAVAAVGVPVAAVGLVGATVLAPTLSIPATAGVVAAVIAVVGGAWLLVG